MDRKPCHHLPPLVPISPEQAVSIMESLRTPLSTPYCTCSIDGANDFIDWRLGCAHTGQDYVAYEALLEFFLAVLSEHQLSQIVTHWTRRDCGCIGRIPSLKMLHKPLSHDALCNCMQKHSERFQSTIGGLLIILSNSLIRTKCGPGGIIPEFLRLAQERMKATIRRSIPTTLFSALPIWFKVEQGCMNTFTLFRAFLWLVGDEILAEMPRHPEFIVHFSNALTSFVDQAESVCAKDKASRGHQCRRSDVLSSVFQFSYMVRHGLSQTMYDYLETVGSTLWKTLSRFVQMVASEWRADIRVQYVALFTLIVYSADRSPHRPNLPPDLVQYALAWPEANQLVDDFTPCTHGTRADAILALLQSTQDDSLRCHLHPQYPDVAGVVPQRCTGCRVVRYCSQGCQREDWKSHKSICKYLRLVSDTYYGSTNGDRSSSDFVEGIATGLVADAKLGEEEVLMMAIESERYQQLMKGSGMEG